MLATNKLFVINKVLIANEIRDNKNSNKSIEKFVKLKIKKLSKSKKLFKAQNLAKSNKK